MDQERNQRYVETNENENTKTHTLTDTVNAVLK